MTMLLSLLWLFLWIFTLAHSGLMNEKMGPYDITNVAVYHCEDEGTKEFSFVVKTRKISRTAFGFQFNVTLTNHTVGRNTTGRVYVDRFTDGRWNEGFIMKELPELCANVKQFIPNSYKILVDELGGEECNYPPGFYQLREMTLADAQLATFPQFYYNRFRSRCFIKDGSVTIGCMAAQADLVPKLRKPKNGKNN